jgi:hypothetical protein
MDWTTEQSVFNSHHEQGLSYPKHPEKAIGYTKQLGTGVKQPQCEAGHATSFSTKVKNENSHASFPPLAFVTHTGTNLLLNILIFISLMCKTVFMYNKLPNVLILHAYQLK